jgi:iron complex transport system substrate-binding protein
MKAKSKVIVLMEIVIVLCSLFLVTLPATTIAAEEDDYILGIYGNANEDDTIDMRDLTYVKLIFFGKKPETELADAKYDGKINPLDFIQIKLIIVGKEKELTVLQYLGYPPFTEEPVTVPMPIERTVVMSGSYGPKMLCAFGEQDRMVGVNRFAKMAGELKTFLEDKPAAGSTFKWDMEKIMELKPDIVLAYAYMSWPDYEEQLNAVDIPLVQMDLHQPKKYSREVRNLGWMLDKQEKAEELINFEQQYFDLIEERVKDLEEEQKPHVYFEWYADYQAVGPGSSNYNALILGGGINIFADIVEKYPEIDPETVLDRNPQVIIKAIYSTSIAGYDVTDTGPMEELRNAIMSRPGWDSIDAVKNGKVYIITSATSSTHPSVYHSYFAKWLHPDLFHDIDPVDIHRAWIRTFLGIEYKGVYAYPLP